MSNENFVMVYGTLKQGFHNHEIISYDYDTHSKNKGYDYLGKVNTIDRFKMYDMGSFPAIAFDPNGKIVAGELYAVDDKTLELIDMLEGYPDHYERKEVMLDVGVEAWVYFYNPDNVTEDMIEVDCVDSVYTWDM